MLARPGAGTFGAAMSELMSLVGDPMTQSSVLAVRPRVWLLLILIAMGCGRSDLFQDQPAPPPTPPPVPTLAERALTFEGYCGALLEAVVCNPLQCGIVGSGVTCDTLLNPLGNHYADPCDARLREGIAAGSITYDVDAGTSCLQRLESTCTDFDCDVFHGRLPRGEICVSGAECAAGLFCDPRAWRCGGLCMPLLDDGKDVFGRVGCKSQRAIDLVDGGSRCTSLGDAGMPCAAASDERQDRLCGFGLVCSQGSCVRGPVEGQACAPGSQCQYPLRCGANGLCEQRDDLGQPCTRFSCKLGLACTSGTCTRLPVVGEACPEFSCASSFFCNRFTGKCVALGPAGASCGSELDCQGSLTCTSSNTCAARARLGASCIVGRECAVGLNCISGTCALAHCL